MSQGIHNSLKRTLIQDDEDEYQPHEKYTRIEDYERHLHNPSISPPVNDSGLGSSICSVPSPPIINQQPHSSQSTHLPPILSTNFCLVVGRLSLNGLPRKYSVTVDEIKRRVGPPECLNSSVLTGMLRKAKLSGKSRSLRDELAERGIDIKLGRKKQSTTTAFTALLEGEALSLAQDLDGLTQEHYPINQLASHLRARAIGTCRNPEEFEIFRRDLIGFMKTFSFVEAELREIESPICDRNPQPHENEELQHGIDQYSLLTHGFAPYNLQTWLRTFMQVSCTTLTQMESVINQSPQFSLQSSLQPLQQPHLQQIAQLPPLCAPQQPGILYPNGIQFGGPPPPGMYNLYQPSFLPLLPSADELAQSNFLPSTSTFQPHMSNDWSKTLTPIN